MKLDKVVLLIKRDPVRFILFIYDSVRNKWRRTRSCCIAHCGSKSSFDTYIFYFRK